MMTAYLPDDDDTDAPLTRKTASPPNIAADMAYKQFVSLAPTRAKLCLTAANWFLDIPLHINPRFLHIWPGISAESVPVGLGAAASAEPAAVSGEV